MEKLDDTPDGNDSPHTNAGTKSEKTTVTVPLPTLVAVTPDRRPPLTDYRGLWCWGYGEFGQHGHGRDGEVAFEGGEIKQFEEEQVKLVCCGASHTFVVTENNTLYTWGNGNSGQLGCGEAITQWSACGVQLLPGRPFQTPPPLAGVACGGRHTFAWLLNGHMFSWGNNYYAQLGYDFHIENYKENQLEETLKSQRAGGRQVFYMARHLTRGTVPSLTQLTPHLLKTLTYRPVIEVACGEKHTLLLFQHGLVAVMGNNAHGQIGDGSRTEATVPKVLEDLSPVRLIASGSNHNVIVTERGEILVWGHGKGCGVRKGDVLEPQQVSLATSRITLQIAAGQTHSVALTGEGVLYSWGFGADGQLGHGDVHWLDKPCSIRKVCLPRPVVQVACGDNYTAAVSVSGGLYMWGKNSHVIVGDLPPSHRLTRPHRINPVEVPVAYIACGSWHAAAIIGYPDYSHLGFDENTEDALWSSSDEEGDEEEETGAFPVADRCTQTSRMSWQSKTSASGCNTEDDLDRGLSQEGIQRSFSLAQFYAPSTGPTAIQGVLQKSELMEIIPMSSKRTSGAVGDDTPTRVGLVTSGQGDDGHFHVGVLKPQQSLYSEGQWRQTGSTMSLVTSIPAGDVPEDSDLQVPDSRIIATQAGYHGTGQFSKFRSNAFISPREKSSVQSQHLDVSAGPLASEPLLSPRSRFHIDQHVSLRVASTAGTSSRRSSGWGPPPSRPLTDRGSAIRPRRTQAPHVALRRSETLYGMQSSNKKLRKVPSVEQVPAKTNTPQEFALMVPRTVTFIADDIQNGGTLPGNQNLSIPHRMYTRHCGPEMGLIAERSQLQRETVRPGVSPHSRRPPKHQHDSSTVHPSKPQLNLSRGRTLVPTNWGVQPHPSGAPPGGKIGSEGVLPGGAKAR